MKIGAESIIKGIDFQKELMEYEIRLEDEKRKIDSIKKRNED